jgi:MFS family permease
VLRRRAIPTAAPRDEKGAFGRWIAANVSVAVPLSMAPITFGLAALSRGDLNGGALMMTAMTAAEVVGAVPIATAGRRLPATAYARLLAASRTVAFVGLALALSVHASLAVLVVAASAAGLVNGALVGVLRAILNDMVATAKLPRALGVAATANEVVFVTGPIVASTLGGASVIAAVGVMAISSAVPIAVLPRDSHRMPRGLARAHRGSIPLGTGIWLFARVSMTACVASIEVGAVALALRDDLEPRAALLFVVPLCIASVLGGVWISVRNRRLRRPTVASMLLLTGGAMLVVRWDPSLWSVIAGVVLVGMFLAPLSTAFSLFLDDLLPAGRRAEGFALLRSAHAIGLIVASALIALVSLDAAFLVAAALAVTSVVVVAAAGMGRRRLRGRPPGDDTA